MYNYFWIANELAQIRRAIKLPDHMELYNKIAVMKNYLLTIDVGNTQIVIGVYKERKLKAHWRLDTKARRTEDELTIMVSQLFRLADIGMDMVSGVAICCVVPPLTPMLIQFCKKAFDLAPLVVGPGIKTGIPIDMDDPREVGADRIANAAGGLLLYDPPLIVVDFGTAITIDAISESSEYKGGVIVPGLSLSLNALYHNAARLPKVELAEPPSVIGRNTIHSMQSGAYYGYVSLVDGIVKRMKPELGDNATVIATGGEVGMLANASETIEHVEENLTLEGLRAIYELSGR